jgi:hypothetical protein
MTASAPAAPSLTPPQVEIVRAHHRGTRTAGFVACLLGALALIAGRFSPGLPAWVTSAGLAVIVLGWGLFGYALFKRVALARSLAAGADR